MYLIRSNWIKEQANSSDHEYVYTTCQRAPGKEGVGPFRCTTKIARGFLSEPAWHHFAWLVFKSSLRLLCVLGFSMHSPP